MSEEVHITKPTAILATEKGYINTMMAGYYTAKNDQWGSAYLTEDLYESKTGWFAPSQAVLQKWLRDKHNIDIMVTVDVSRREYSWEIHKESNKLIGSDFNEYEESLEDALQEGLKLI